MSIVKINEIEQINKALDVYFEGIKTLNSDMIYKVFHKDARIKTINQEGNLAMQNSDIWNKICTNIKENVKDKSEYKVFTTVENIDLEEDTASVKVNMVVQMPKRIDKFNDYYHMLKLGEKWMITSKTYHGEHEDR